MLQKQNAKKSKDNEEILNNLKEDDCCVKTLSYKCPCAKKLLYSSNGQQVILYEAEVEHNFHNIKSLQPSKGFIIQESLSHHPS